MLECLTEDCRSDNVRFAMLKLGLDRLEALCVRNQGCTGSSTRLYGPHDLLNALDLLR